MPMHVVIATHGRPGLLRRTLLSLADADRPRTLERVWVLENGEPSGVREAIAELGGRLPLHYHHVPIAGKSRALQRAVEMIGDGLLVFLDDDVRVAPGVLTAYERAADDADDLSFFGGPLRIDYEAAPPPQWLRAHLPASAIGWEPEDPHDPLKGIGFFLGANYAVQARHVLHCGGFNADFGPGARRPGTDGNPMGQEADLQFRLQRHGYRPVYVPDAEVWHFVPHERCTPEWTLHREYRRGMTLALMTPLEQIGRPRLGAPPWLWRRLMIAGVTASLGRFAPMPRTRFLTGKPLRLWSGYRHGILTHGQSAASADRPAIPQNNQPNTSTPAVPMKHAA